MDYYKKYVKYKHRYLDLCNMYMNMYGGVTEKDFKKTLNNII